ncbi:hypothetical protein FP2506_05986 [Fulvimarina pelagi HTCC2506]|uniref:VOC domain-containing protein n=1 Tax=Fulvimarina pelagi HTCC2506 TaxID=314231 RepID=Q0G7J9_9HYPH|nr:VOC family protein [Fulvimarina pelagi]EAU42365.1 hypothetical protein FP2506_05986 [Fulvimarina pelagi HTCC2506]
MQQVAVITLGIGDLEASARFYGEGFGWAPVFRNPEIIFYQMNGFVLATWLVQNLQEDVGVAVTSRPGSMALAHNVRAETEVAPLMERLVAAGGQLLRPADAPPHGGLRGYVADPDGHIWEIAFNPVWPIGADGSVTFAAK